jgi:hypothetical protein
MCRGLGLRHRVTVETLMSDTYAALDSQGNPNPGFIPSLSAANTAPVKIEKTSSKLDAAAAARENQELAARAMTVKNILLYTAIESPAVPGKVFSSVGSSQAWLDYVRQNPDVSFKTPAIDSVTGQALRDAKTGDIVVRPMTGAQICELFDKYYSTGLTPEGQQVWDNFLERIDGTYRQALREHKASEQVINPLIERVKDGREKPRANNPLQALYNSVVRISSGNSISWTIQPTMGKHEINDGRILLASYLEGMRKTLRHYDVFNLENELTRETVVGNLARETNELLGLMGRRQQEYQGSIIVRPSIAETMFNRYNPLYRMAESFIEHTFTRRDAVTAYANYGCLLGLGFGAAFLGPQFLAITGGVAVVNWGAGTIFPTLKRWLGASDKPSSS